MESPVHNQNGAPCFATGAGIICAGLPRSGTASLARALEILGFGPVHHGLQIRNNREFYAWGQAAWCSFPYLQETRLTGSTAQLPRYMSPTDPLLPWTRADWDRLIGWRRVTTDLGSMFTEQLITAYPEAKVILVERPVEKWMASFRDVLLDGVFTGFNGFILCTLGILVNKSGSATSSDVCMGWLKANSRREALERMPIVHKEHYAMVRRVVPSEQLLDFKLQDGWTPLCTFLEVPIPDEPFPHINDSKELLAGRDYAIKFVLKRVAKVVGYYAIVAAALGVALHEQSRTRFIEYLRKCLQWQW